MKVTLMIPKSKCRKCVYNDFKRAGVDCCARAGCIYKVKEKEVDENEQN